MARHFREPDVLSALEDLVNKDCKGSQAEAARRLNVSRQYVGDLLRRRRGISPEVADKLGFVFHFNQEEWYEKKVMA